MTNSHKLRSKAIFKTSKIQKKGQKSKADTSIIISKTKEKTKSYSMMIQKKKSNSKIIMLQELNNHLILIIMINRLIVDPIWLRSYFIKITDHIQKLMNLKVVFSKQMIIVEVVQLEFRNLFRKFWTINRNNWISL